MSNTSHEKTKPVQQELPFVPTFGEIEINGVSVVTATFEGKLLMALIDLAKIMNYPDIRFTRNCEDACTARLIDLNMYLTWIKFPVGRSKRFINLNGLRVLCAVLLPRRTESIRRWMAEHASDTPEGTPMFHINAKVFRAAICGHQVTAAFIRNRIWVSPSSISLMLGYKREISSVVNNVLSRHFADFSQHKISIRHTGGPSETFIDAEAIEYLSKRTGRGQPIVAWMAELENWSEGVEALILKVGGTDVHDAREVVKPPTIRALPGVQSQSPTNGTPMASAPVPEIQAAAPTNVPGKGVQTLDSLEGVGNTDAMLSEVPALPAPAPTPAPQAQPKPNAKTERKRDYCKKLCAVVARYLTADELPALAQALETFKGSILQQRYAPGLNDAAYDLYANFHLRGPAVGQAGKVVQ